MSEDQYKNQRRRYFIDHKFQTDFVLKFTSVIVLSSLLIGLVVYWLARSSTTVTIENTQVMIKSTSDFILPLLIITILSVTALSSLTVLVMMVFISHRIAGPAYRLKKEVNLLREGNLNRSFQMRRKDQLLELAEALEGLTRTWKDKHQQIKEKCDAIHHDLEKSKQDLSSEDVKLVKQHLRDLKSALDYFKLQ